MDRIGVIGSGAWGTALAMTALRAGRDVVLWAREPAVARAITETHANPDYLPGIPLDPRLNASLESSAALRADAILLVVPAQHLRSTCAGLAETFMGLSGMGDLILTATSMQSRNFSLGHALGQGQSLGVILGGRKAVTEGVFTASAVCALAGRLNVDMPLCGAVNALLNHDADLDSVIEGLLTRPFRGELEHTAPAP